VFPTLSNERKLREIRKKVKDKKNIWTEVSGKSNEREKRAKREGKK